MDGALLHADSHPDFDPRCFRCAARSVAGLIVVCMGAFPLDFDDVVATVAPKPAVPTGCSSSTPMGWFQAEPGFIDTTPPCRADRMRMLIRPLPRAVRTKT